MSLALATYMLGSHAFFFREGDPYTVPSAGTAGRNAKPGAADTGWIDMGVIEESSDSLEDTEVEVYAPTPGRLRLYDVLHAKDKLMIKFTTSEFGPIHLETLYRTLALTGASTQYNPLEGKTKKGWLKVQRYDQGDAQRIVMDVFCRLKISGDVNMGGGELAKAQFEALVLHSTLNTGLI